MGLNRFMDSKFSISLHMSVGVRNKIRRVLSRLGSR